MLANFIGALTTHTASSFASQYMVLHAWGLLEGNAAYMSWHNPHGTGQACEQATLNSRARPTSERPPQSRPSCGWPLAGHTVVHFEAPWRTVTG